MPRPADDELIAHTAAPLSGSGGLGLRDDGRRTGLARSVGRFALACLAFAIVSSVPLVPFDRHFAIFVFLAFASTAWLPFALALPLVFAGARRPRIASVLAGMVAGSLLAFLQALFETWLRTSPPDTSPVGGVPFSWLNVLRSLPEALELLAPIGALGGVAFWAIYFWLPTRVGTARSAQQA